MKRFISTQFAIFPYSDLLVFIPWPWLLRYHPVNSMSFTFKKKYFVFKCLIAFWNQASGLKWTNEQITGLKLGKGLNYLPSYNRYYSGLPFFLKFNVTKPWPKYYRGVTASWLFMPLLFRAGIFSLFTL